MEPVCPVCREREMVIIQLEVADRDVTLLSCAACGSRWWRRDGIDVEVGNVVELAAAAAASGSRRRKGRPSRTA